MTTKYFNCIVIKKVFFTLTLLFFQNLFTQNHLFKTQKLAATCKVWGFLKYYHPRVANGEFNWDKQLFEILPKIEEAKTKEDFSLVLNNWIDALGEIKKIEPIMQSKDVEYFDKNFDLSWIDKNKLFSKKLSQKLNFIHKNRNVGKQFYINDNKENLIEISNEVKYPDFNWNEKNHRIVTLFRYWNLVEYFFPYKYMMDQKWSNTLNEMLQRFMEVKSELDFNLLLKELVVKLDDTHATFGSDKLFEHFGSKFIPVNVKIIDDLAIIVSFQNDSLAKINDLEINDVISKVNSKKIKQIIKNNLKYAEGSNKLAKLNNIYWVIFNGNTNTLQIETIRNGKSSTKTINRYLYQDLNVSVQEKEKFKQLENNIGYVDMGEIEPNDLPELMTKFKNTKAIIFDIRNYPNETLYLIAEYLNPYEKEYAKFIGPDLSYPGRYIWEKSDKCGKINLDYYKGKVVILINEKTISQAEQTAMCLQVSPKATIIGSQTSGADGNNMKFEIIKGFRTSFSGIGVFYPNKKETQRIGIKPDIEVKPTIKGIQEGRDEVLERALYFVKTGK